MIEKLEPIKAFNCSDTPQAKMQHHIYHNDCINKINELVDAVNNQQIQLNNHECRLLDLQKRITALDDPTHHEAEPAPADTYAEQRKWIGKLCKVYDDNDFVHYAVLEKILDNSDYCYGTPIGDYKHCEPVKPDDYIIYRGE